MQLDCQGDGVALPGVPLFGSCAVTWGRSVVRNGHGKRQNALLAPQNVSTLALRLAPHMRRAETRRSSAGKASSNTRVN